MSHNIKVVQPSGTLDSVRGNQLRREIGDVVATGADIVLIDLENVTYLDSSGLGALVSAQRIVQTSGGKLYLCSINDQAKILFELAKMNTVFKVFVDRDEFNRQVLSTE